MYPRTEYEMSKSDLASIMDACKAVPAMMIGGYAPSSPQENANNAWAAVGKKMGFDHMTVRPISGKGERFFTAVPSETETQRTERLERQAAKNKATEIAELEADITEKQDRLATLRATPPQGGAR